MRVTSEIELTSACLSYSVWTYDTFNIFIGNVEIRAVKLNAQSKLSSLSKESCHLGLGDQIQYLVMQIALDGYASGGEVCDSYLVKRQIGIQ